MAKSEFNFLENIESKDMETYFLQGKMHFNFFLIFLGLVRGKGKKLQSYEESL